MILNRKFFAAGAACMTAAVLFCGCSSTPNAGSQVDDLKSTFKETEHTEICDISRHDCEMYQWFVFSDDRTVLDCGVTVNAEPQITDENGVVGVASPMSETKTDYREYNPATGEMTPWYSMQDMDGQLVCFTQDVVEFSFPEILEQYWDATEGVNRDSFVNYNEGMSDIESADDAYERAKNEISSEYRLVEIRRDYENEMWEVSFSQLDMTDKQTVYLDNSGKTWLIISE